MVSPLADMTRCVLLFAVLASLAALPECAAQATPSDAKPAATMHDLRDHFASCFQPPGDAAGTRVTFYFSLNNRGQVIAQPRTTWIGFKGSEDERLRRLAGFETAFDRCLPLSMDPQLAATIPGKVYFLQFIVADTGGGSQVLLRPFGSHYYGGGGIGSGPSPGFEPVLPQRVLPPVAGPPPVRTVRGPLVRPFRPFVGPLPQLLRLHRAQIRASAPPRLR